MIRSIALKLGDVSKTPISWTIFTAENSFPETKYEALSTLVQYLWAKFFFENVNYKRDNLKDCCYISLNAKPTAKFCIDCGTKLNFVFSLGAWYSFLCDIGFKTAEEYGLHDELIEYNFFGWSPWNYEFNTNQDEIIIIPDKCVEILTKLLLDVFPDIQTELGFVPKFYINDFYNNLIDDKTIFLGNGYGRRILKP